MIKTPFHKQTDPAKQAGQVKNDITLGDYLENKYPEEMKKKMTFDEWWNINQPTTNQYDCFMECWDAAQENK